MKAFNLFIKKHNIYLLLACIILLQTVCLTVSFANNKKGYHSDELWSYGFACSSDGMNVFLSETAERLKTWINGLILLSCIIT